jgi:mitochondrial ribonuclease P protein 3
MSDHTEDDPEIAVVDDGLKNYGMRKHSAPPTSPQNVNANVSSSSESITHPLCADDHHPVFQPYKKMKKKHMDPAILEFRCCIQQCCRDDDLLTAILAYDRAIAAQTRIEAPTFYSLLNLCDGLSGRGIHVGTPKRSKLITDHGVTLDTSTLCHEHERTTVSVPVNDVTRRIFAERLKRHMDDMKLALTENAYTALVRIFCRAKDFHEAERILNEAEMTQQCKAKLRLYTPLLVAYCELGRLLEAVTVWHRITMKGLVLSESEYCALIQCCRKTGNVVVFERVLSDLSEEIFVPSHETTRSIINWFESPHAVGTCFQPPHMEESNIYIQELLKTIQVPYEETTPIAGLMSTTAIQGWIISRQCSIDPQTGLLLSGCLKGESLKPFALTVKAWEDMKRMNEKIAVTGKISENDTTDYQGGGKGRKMVVDAHALAGREKHWLTFQECLERLEHPVSILIDGANVGFYEQNFAGAPKHVDYNQIDWIVQHFMQKMKQGVLLVMHSRHFAQNLMPSYAEPILQKWVDSGLLYRTPPGMNDDWFWLHAALHFGPETLIVTNDEMRDHNFQMVAPRSFVRWRDRHQIHFDFGGWMKDNHGRSLGYREVKLKYPDPYSRRIQRVLDGLVLPLPKKGDMNRFLDGAFVADDEPVEEMYLCIRQIPKE